MMRRMAETNMPFCARQSLQAVLLALSLSSVTTSAVAQYNAHSVDQKWRPKDGIYGKQACREQDKGEDEEVIAIELAKKSVDPFEQNCTVSGLTDTAPGTIRLDVACTDVLTDKPFPEVFILKKVDNDKIFVRETQDGKFTRPGGQMIYCSDEDQRAYIDSQKKNE
jgi:hypothetical protein